MKGEKVYRNREKRESWWVLYVPVAYLVIMLTIYKIDKLSYGTERLQEPYQGFTAHGAGL